MAVHTEHFKCESHMPGVERVITAYTIPQELDSKYRRQRTHWNTRFCNNRLSVHEDGRRMRDMNLAVSFIARTEHFYHLIIVPG